ncbi:hypothetical protein ACW9IB_01300 [Pseudomonas sp. SDO524_S393]
MSPYTLLLATVLNVNKELPVQAGLTLEACTAAAMQALQEHSNYAKCRPAQPEKPIVFLKLPSGTIVRMKREHGGYFLAPGHSVADQDFVATALGKPSSGVHSRVHGPEKMLKGTKLEAAVATE